MLDTDYKNDDEGRFSKLTKYIKVQSRLECAVFCEMELRRRGSCGNDRVKAQDYLSLYDAMIINKRSVG